MIALLALATAWGNGTLYFDGWPPPRYTRNATAFVHFAGEQAITAKCDADDPSPADMTTEGCSFGPPNEIYIPNPCTFPAGDRYARLLCHEIGHLNGWPDNHPK